LETLMLYIPLAHQLGLYNIKSEMEDIYFRYSDPQSYRAITNKLKATEKDRERLTREFIEPLKQKLSEQGIKYTLKVRTKTAYSIFRKMNVQGVPFEGVFDVFAIRFIVDCPPDRSAEQDLCWKVYSYVTDEYEPDTTRLRDWITNPKPNGYESLHITVKNRQGNCIEVQIRSRRMDDIAEKGLASHWSYKGVKGNSTLDNWLASVRSHLENHSESGYEDSPTPPSGEIFVFTPSGELKILREGSSVLDFAFSIHSSLGCHCTGGRVNGKQALLRDKLHTGDTVEILSSRNQKPGKDWMNWVITSKARSKIKQELDAEERKKAAAGRELLERRLKNWKLELTDEMRTEFMKSRKYGTVIAFLSAIADGELDVNEIKVFILSASEGERRDASLPERPGSALSSPVAAGEEILVLSAKDVKGLSYKLARCCNPVFGDDVFGFVTRTEGIKIHRISCPNAARLIERYPYRIQRVRWQETTQSGTFQCTLMITAEMDHPVLSAIMDQINRFKVSLRAFNVSENQRNGTYEISVRLLVPSNMELDKVISTVSALKQVEKVKRL
ncbi:MAG: bifunctional (p)ppGpp synthetase/guanosine-3',5'-bis(diphosphate) 3'-pyrophosphohydrolase, partial [Bacteroidales bacterium]|nr:bifunctional (p)ppGpp synthetase/guanosine-3',5'-bis(diphosphate) 3'-pyrophosphohydrolase [Bacteroidales bacterium]